jgi:hypothetical protein
MKVLIRSNPTLLLHSSSAVPVFQTHSFRVSEWETKFVTFSYARREEQRFRVFENKVLMRIFGREREVAQKYRT